MVTGIEIELCKSWIVSEKAASILSVCLDTNFFERIQKVSDSSRCKNAVLATFNGKYCFLHFGWIVIGSDIPETEF